MTTPKDQQRTDALRSFSSLLGGSERLAGLMMLNQRSLQRMLSGAKPPPPRLLEACADWIDRQNWGAYTDWERGPVRCAQRLRDAAAVITPIGRISDEEIDYVRTARIDLPSPMIGDFAAPLGGEDA